MVALSDSRVTSGSSLWTTLPGATWISMTGTSAKSPRSGTPTSVTAAMSNPLTHANAGSALSGSMPYREIASATLSAGIAPSAASDVSAARAT